MICIYLSLKINIYIYKQNSKEKGRLNIFNISLKFFINESNSFCIRKLKFLLILDIIEVPNPLNTKIILISVTDLAKVYSNSQVSGFNFCIVIINYFIYVLPLLN